MRKIISFITLFICVLFIASEAHAASDSYPLNGCGQDAWTPLRVTVPNHGTQIEARGKITCSGNTKMAGQTCVQVANGSSWFTKSDTCVADPSNAKSGGTVIVTSDFIPADTTDAVRGHKYRTWFWAKVCNPQCAEQVNTSLGLVF